MAARVLCVGEALIDAVTRDGQVVEHVGGSPYNVACGLGRLGHDTTLAAWIGRDARGAAIEAAAAASGVRLAPGSDGARRTPVAHARLDAAGAASYTFDVEWDLPALPADADHLHVGSISTTIEPGGGKVLAAVRDATGTVSYDPNVRPTIMGEPGAVAERIAALMAASDVVKASDEDAAWLHPGVPLDEVARRWLASGPALVVLTRGGAGAWAWLADGVRREVAPVPGPVVDTVGAGDSFMAGLLSGLLDFGYLGGRAAGVRLREATWPEIEPALRRAVLTASLTVGRAGAYGPTRDELVGAAS